MAWLLRGILVLAFAAVTLAPSTALARRGGIILITYGDSIKDLGQVPAEIAPVIEKATGQSGLRVGYKYSYFGLFWLDLWTWGGDFCLYRDRSFIPLKPEMAAALLKTKGAPSKPITYTIPPLLPVLGLLVVFGVIASRQQAEREQAKKLFSDVRYIQVMLRFDDAASRTGSLTPTTQEIALARDQLVAEGVDGPEADRTLALLVKTRPHQDVQNYWNAFKVALAEAALADQQQQAAAAAAAAPAADPGASPLAT
jgi:hypothetical protein